MTIGILLPLWPVFFRLVGGDFWGRVIQILKCYVMAQNNFEQHRILDELDWSNSKPAYSNDERDAMLKAMKMRRQESGGDAPVENPNIPAGFTYLGQLITHDMSPVKESDRANFEPMLRLKSIYGNGPAKHQGVYLEDISEMQDLLTDKFIDLKNLNENNLYKKLKGALIRERRVKSWGRDLARKGNDKKGNVEPYMVDDRNDRNYLLSQLTVAIIRFHNAVVAYYAKKNPNLNNNILLEKAQETVIQHYQWIIVHEFLPMLVQDGLVDRLIADENNIEFRLFNFNPAQKAKLMPEFSEAAFRFGHSQVREVYVVPRINSEGQSVDEKSENRKNRARIFLDADSNKRLDDLEENAPDQQDRKDLRGHIFRYNLRIDWRGFFDFGTGVSNELLQYSLAIDHKIAHPMFDLFFLRPDEGNPNREENLTKRDLEVGRGLPSGSALHEAYFKKYQSNTLPLSTDDILKIFPGLRIDQIPLGLYLLLEAELREGGNRLGELGSRIVAEQIIWVLKADPDSILNQPEWQPNPEFSQWRRPPNNTLVREQGMSPEVDQFNIIDLLQYPDPINI